MSFVLAIDQGTTSSRAIVFRSDISIAATAQAEFPQHFPASGWVEHEPEDIWTHDHRHLPRGAGEGRRRRRRTSPRSASPTSARPPWCGTAAPASAIHRAIVWQDRRTADVCARLKAEGHEPRDHGQDRPARSIPISPAPRSPGFSTTSPARAHAPSAASSPSARSTTYLLWRLTGGKVHATDATNASRTLLFDIHTGDWDDELLALLRRAALDAARGEGLRRPISATTDPGAVRRQRSPIRGIAGDQQAATDRPGLLLAGHDEVDLRHRLLRAAQHRRHAGRLARTGCSPPSPTSSAASAPTRWKARSSSPAPRCSGCATGSASSSRPSETGPLAAEGRSRRRRSILVPAFVGLGAPYWDRRGARRAVRSHPQHRPRRTRPRRARKRLLPDARSYRRDARRLARRQDRQHRAARRRRHGRLGLDHAAPRRSARTRRSTAR